MTFAYVAKFPDGWGSAPDRHQCIRGTFDQAPVRFKRAPRGRKSFARYGSGSLQDGPEPAQLVAEMQEAGAEFYVWNDAERRDFRFAHRLRENADAERCKAIVAQVRADPDLLALFKVQVFVMIVRQALDLPARRR